MNRLVCLGLLLASIATSAASEGLELVWAPGKKALCKLSEEQQQMAYAKARALVGQYLKRSGTDWRATYDPGGSETWVELSDLHFTYIEQGHVYDDDRRNGIEDRIQVWLGCKSYRIRQRRDTEWPDWSPGRYVKFPTVIQVEKRGGKWTASSKLLKKFAPIGRVWKPSGLPPGMSRD